MLAKALGMQLNADMSKPVKRTRTVADKTSATGITIRPLVDKQGYVSHLVQGWKENGKWQRKQFKERQDAETFVALKRVEQENTGRAQRLVLSPLTETQHEQALKAFDLLGDTYPLADAVRYFLKHHRPPEFTIRLADAIKLYRDAKERDGLRPRSLQSIAWTLGAFTTATDNPHVHEVTAAQVDTFLLGLRAKNGKDKATRRSWEIHRGALSGFFAWSATADAASNRPFTFANPIDTIRKFSSRQVREEQDAKPTTTTPQDVRRMLSALIRWRGGKMVKPYALLYFTGIRPNELRRMAGRESELVNLKTRTITIPANVSKTRQERQVHISDNLAAWLEAFTGPVIPPDFERLNKKLRKHFGLSHDEARHSFISYHVALHRSIGDAALQAGNSEAIVKRHYLNTHTREEGGEFFRIIPGKRRAELAKPKKEQPSHLRAV
jgi:integrase